MCQHKHPDGSVCGAVLDPKGQHARSCAVGGWLVRRHDAGCAVLKAWCEEVGCTVHEEVVLPHAAASRPEARMDLIIHAPRVAVPIRVDLTVVSALSQDALARGSARRAGTAAAAAENDKRARYPGLKMVPFVIEDHGRMGEDALALVRLLAPPLDVERSAAIRWLQQALGSVLQRHAADAVLAATRHRAWRGPRAGR